MWRDKKVLLTLIINIIGILFSIVILISDEITIVFIFSTIAVQRIHLINNVIFDDLKQVELDEIESRNEEYPMTLGFLNLLNTLTDIPVPAGLGAGVRAPGFDPYLEFIEEGVFLKFASRGYKKPAEKVQYYKCIPIKVIKSVV